MSFQPFLLAPFAHASEVLSFKALVTALREECDQMSEPHYLIGNVSLEGDEIDAIFLKPGAISIIEMKNYGGRIHFSENGDWYADDVVVKGTNGGNPFRQVRRYKFTLLDYLKRRENKILKSTKPVTWHHIQGMVLFGQNIHFDEHLPHNIRLWFQICDHQQVAKNLCSRYSAEIHLEPLELEGVLRCLELNETHRYVSRQPIVKQEVPPAVTLPSGRLRVVIHKDSGFRESWLRMNQAGGIKSEGAIQVQKILDELRRGINALLRFTSSTDARVAGSTVYSINSRCQLVVFRVKNFLYPWFVDEPDGITDWFEANEGLTLVVDGGTQRIVTTTVGTVITESNIEPSKPTIENLPLLSRVPSIDLSVLVTKALVRKHLRAFTEETPEAEIMEVLDLIEDESLRLFLFDVINLIRKNDIAGAEARIRLPQGDACPVEDAAALAEEAVESGINSDQILEITKKEELEGLLDPDHFHEWMLYLHKDQKEIVEADFAKPTILTGVSGSGKTCILVHRARHLARKYPGERIAVMTLNRALADLLRNLVDQICTEEERKNIQVLAFYDYFKQLLHDLGPQFYLNQLIESAPESKILRQVIRGVNPVNLANEVDILSGETSENTWDDFFDQKDDEVHSKLLDAVQTLEAYRIDASRYLREECTLVRSALTVAEREKYLDGKTFPREGRAIPFQHSIRKDVRQIILLFEEWMLAGGVLDVVELTQAVTPLWAEIRKLPPQRRFRCLLIDEFQDFSTLDLRLLLHVPTSAENGLFLAGDTVQKILVKRLRLEDAALGKGNVERKEIRKNYRNSRQILKAASKLANHYCDLAKAQGEEVEILDPELAQRTTCPPFAIKTNDVVRKAWEIALEWLEQGATNAWTVCIATAAPETISVASILELKPIGIRAKELTGDFLKNPETLIVGTIQDLKGFEFRLVILVGCEAGALPSPGVPLEEAWREALRLYVAMTRARDQVYFLYEMNPSEFLCVMSPDVLFREHPVSTDYEIEPESVNEGAPIRQHAEPLPALSNEVEKPELDESCESIFDECEREILHKYFAKHVYEKPNAQCESFRDWLRPRYLREISFADLVMIGRQDKKAFKSLRQKFIRFEFT